MIMHRIIRDPRRQRRLRVRARIYGTRDRPRLSVFRSNRRIYAQVIDDSLGATLVGKMGEANSPKLTKQAAAYQLGKLLAKAALAKKIKRVVFDRGAYLYHGRVASLARGARDGGLEF